jgi:DNA polymerase alpha-associated DNA helicase A
MSVFTPSTPEQVKTFITTHIDLLKKECEVEASETSLLLSKCPPKLLEQRGLALGGLGVVGVNIGLGGKR